jgi:hypothetical protein
MLQELVNEGYRLEVTVLIGASIIAGLNAAILIGTLFALRPTSGNRD